jgi:hypothetical protein
MRLKQFCIRFLLGIFALLIVVGLFNRIIDPFWYYRDTEINGLNAIKTKFGGYERIVKPALLVRDQPDAIILGSSYSEIGFDPTNSNFTNQKKFKGMNFAMARASWEMVQCDFAFAVEHAKIKRALIGFHPGALPKADCTKDFSTIGKLNEKELLLSSAALSASLKTIQRQKTKDISHTKEGMFFYNRNDYKNVSKRFREDLPILSKPNNSYKKEHQQIDKIGPDKNLDLSGLENIINLAKNHGVELVLYAYPRHAYSLELDRENGQQNQRWQALKQISQLIDREPDEKKQVRIWQFFSYNDITAEKIGENVKYWQDPAHFNYEVGDVMLSDMFGPSFENPKLGRRLIFNNFDADFQNYLSGRANYLLQHPEFQANLKKLTQ